MSTFDNSSGSKRAFVECSVRTAKISKCLALVIAEADYEGEPLQMLKFVTSSTTRSELQEFVDHCDSGFLKIYQKEDIEGLDVEKPYDPATASLVELRELNYNFNSRRDHMGATDNAILEMLTHCIALGDPKPRGAGHSRLIACGMSFLGDERRVIKVIDSLIRAGLLVKAATGGIWWVGYWRAANRAFGLAYMYPGAGYDNGKIVQKKIFYGLKAKKNYKPSHYYDPEF